MFRVHISQDAFSILFRLFSLKLWLLLASAHVLWYTCIYHGWLQLTKRVTFSFLCFLKFRKQFSLQSLKLLCFSFIISYLIFQDLSLVIYICSCILHLLSNILVLLIKTNLSFLFYLYFSFLGFVMGFFTHSVETSFHHLLLLTNFFNNCQLGLHSWISSVSDFICLLGTPLLLQSFLLLCNLSFSLLVLHLFLVGCIILCLQFSNLLCLFAGFLNFFKSSNFFLLEHPNSISQLFYVFLDPQSYWPCLVVSQVFTFNVYHYILVIVGRDLISAWLSHASLHRVACWCMSILGIEVFPAFSSSQFSIMDLVMDSFYHVDWL